MSEAVGAASRRAAPERAGARRRVAALLALAWAALIFWQSSRANPFPFVPTGLLSHDKLLHALAFGLLAGLLRVALAPLAPRRALLAAALVAALYGATDEWHQAHVPGREPDLRDWIADLTGGLAGAAAAGALLRRRGGAG